MDFALNQQYTNTYPIRYVVKPRQPIIASGTFAGTGTIFVYDIITPYAMGDFVVSNVDQDTRTMVGWGMIVRVSINAPAAGTLTIQADLFNGTYTEIDTSPVAIAANTKIQVVTVPVLPCFRIRGRFIGDGASTYLFHSSLTDY